jgi:antitoxin component YwqK of YwqJK toxin-antitoxin module
MSDEFYQDGKLQGEIRIYKKGGDLAYIDTYDKGVKSHRKGFDARGKIDFEQSY